MLWGLVSALAGAIAAAAVVPAAAAGDRYYGSGVTVTFGSGSYARHPDWRGSRYHPPHRYAKRHRGPRVVYVAPMYDYRRPPPRVIYAPPPHVVYVPPPAVIYADPPPVIAPAPIYNAPIYAPPVYAPPALQRVPGGPLELAQPYCREYNTMTVVNGQRVNSYGTACRQPDGAWRIVD